MSHSDVLLDDWVQEHLGDPRIAIPKADEETSTAPYCISGAAVAPNSHPPRLREDRPLRPLMHGETLYAESEILAKDDIPDRPERGLVTIETRGHNQHDTLIMAFSRKLVVPSNNS
ncbi:hypothetical protein ACIQB5_51295 [Streptomyces sp. NPDC088560]|uniref:hypothetical protein n=1 Tax=Streptomyces sp. NPDC088560 TaxID=3365868 RepID=UPI0037FE110E